MLGTHLLFGRGIVSCRHEYEILYPTELGPVSIDGNRSVNEPSAAAACGSGIARVGTFDQSQRPSPPPRVLALLPMAHGAGCPNVADIGGELLGGLLSAVQQRDSTAHSTMGAIHQHTRAAITRFAAAVSGKNYRSVVHPWHQASDVPNTDGQVALRCLICGNVCLGLRNDHSAGPVTRDHLSSHWGSRFLSPPTRTGFVGVVVFLLFGCAAQAQDANRKPTISQKFEQVTACVGPAAQYHQVHSGILKAIIKVESSGNPLAIHRNANGTVDVGIAQMNSMHFKDLAKYGIVPNQLFDACTAIYVAAWHYAKQVSRWGNTWFAVGAYHSATPYYNSRYQALVNNALIELGYIDWPKLAVPPIHGGPGRSRETTASKGSHLLLEDASILAISQ